MEASGVNENTLPELHAAFTHAVDTTAPATGPEMQTDGQVVGEDLPIRVLCRPPAPGKHATAPPAATPPAPPVPGRDGAHTPTGTNPA